MALLQALPVTSPPLPRVAPWGELDESVFVGTSIVVFISGESKVRRVMISGWFVERAYLKQDTCQ